MSILYEWKVMKRGDTVPENAVYAGITNDDGKVYVAKMDNSPGKVNLNNGKIWNFWSESYSSRQESEVLIVHGNCIWREINQGDIIPENAVFGGYDYKQHKVWVGKDITTDEPGKITCLDSSDDKPKMCRLWCHSYYRTSDVQKAKILLVEPEPAPAPAPEPAHAPAPEPAPVPAQKITETCMWGETVQFNSFEEKIKSTSVDLSIDKIVNGIMASIAIAAGELTHLTSLLKHNINLHISNSKYSSSVITRSIINSENEKYYILLKYERKTSDRRTIMGGIFNLHNSDFYLNVKYAVLEPINDRALDKCRQRKDALADNILEEFDD